MIIDSFAPYKGYHCETTAIGNMLQHAGIGLSEPMLFGIGQGLGFIYWDSKGMDFPFIGGRSKPDEVSACIAARLHLNLTTQETSSVAKAWKNVQVLIDRGTPVGLKLDSYYLDYFSSKVHFAAHYAVIYGYDEEYAYMSDTDQQGGFVKTSLTNLALARNAKGNMSSRNLSFTIEPPAALPPLEPAIRTAISNNAAIHLNPPIRNMGVKGIEKMSGEIVKWPARSANPEKDLCLTALLMERGGTGGALFRNLYRDFLKECLDRLADSEIERAHALFTEIAPMWSDVAASIDHAGRTGQHQELKRASSLLLDIAGKEREAMMLLASLGQ